MKANNCFLVKFFICYFLLSSATILIGMYTPQTFEMIRKYNPSYGLMRRGKRVFSKIYLVPQDTQSLKELGLCPLFTQKKSFEMDPFLIEQMTQDLRSQGLSEADIKQQLTGLTTAPGPKYHVFEPSKTGLVMEEKSVALDAPCVVPLGLFGNWNRSLLQLKSLDQFELAEKTSLSPALCAGHALNNACLIRDYAETGYVKYLAYLKNLNEAANFLLNLKIDDWINVEVVKENLQVMSKDFNIDVSNISAVSTVALFDSNLDKTTDFALFNPEEFVYVQKLKKVLQEGLQKNNFVHVIIIGNEEVAESHGHYFAFAIIKAFNDIQYVVLDTLPEVYHLQEGSHERDRLMFVIQNIEQGNASVKLTNVRARPEFLQSLGEHTQESLLEGKLVDERMEESGLFEAQIKKLNDFSRALNRFGIQKQLSKESEESLIAYLKSIQEISDAVGEEFAYPTMKKLITKRLSEMH